MLKAAIPVLPVRTRVPKGIEIALMRWDLLVPAVRRFLSGGGWLPL